MTLPDLELRGITVRFGGLVAVDDVSIAGRSGEITGLIGPNGAGKTTTFNATTGVVPVAAGSVRLGDRVLDRLGTAARAEVGLGRTFQRMELFDSMTVAENVALGPEMRLAGRRPWTHLRASRSQVRWVRDRSEEAIRRCELQPLAQRSTNKLSTGQRRLVELARALASDFDFLLLDEPSSGLDEGETEMFSDILRAVVAERGIGMLVVEHDMALVRSLCSTIHVLDFGKLLTSGPADEVLQSDIVRAAYLGDDVEEVA